MESTQRRINLFKIILIWLACLMLVQLSFRYVWAESTDTVVIGSKAKNMKVLPAWTIELCSEERPLATYTFNQAKQLKIADHACWTAQEKIKAFQIQLNTQQTTIEKLRNIQALAIQIHEVDKKHIANLLKQLNAEIAEKNKYKYKPSYTVWYITAGAVLAAVGLSFGIGVWAAH